jgi:phosphoribosylaminoimidazole-succinocarboxamide synthase
MSRVLHTSKDMAEALLEFSSKSKEDSKYIENMEAEVNQQEQELDVLIDKLLELEKENMYLRILLNKLLSNSDYTIEGLLSKEDE